MIEIVVVIATKFKGCWLCAAQVNVTWSRDLWVVCQRTRIWRHNYDWEFFEFLWGSDQEQLGSKASLLHKFYYLTNAMLKSLLKMKAIVGFKRLPNATSLILTLKMLSSKQDKGNWSWQKLKHFSSTTWERDSLISKYTLGEIFLKCDCVKAGVAS